MGLCKSTKSFLGLAIWHLVSLPSHSNWEFHLSIIFSYYTQSISTISNMELSFDPVSESHYVNITLMITMQVMGEEGEWSR